MGEKTYLGVGLYTYPEAARIIGVHPAVLRRWAREYYYTSRGRPYRHQPVIARSFPDEPILTFLELIELLFVRLFRAEGVSMEVIRRASKRATKIFDSDYPFALKRFDTDGRYIFATLKDDAESTQIIEDLSRGQYAFDSVIRPFFRKLEYQENASALTLWPREREGRIVLDPQRVFGKPIDAETGVPTAVLHEAVIASGENSEVEVAEWYDVPVEAVIAAVAYEQAPGVMYDVSV